MELVVHSGGLAHSKKIGIAKDHTIDLPIGKKHCRNIS